MAIGKLTSLPPGQSRWARIRDEHGNDWSVPAKRLPKEAESGMELAYRLDFSEAVAPQIQILEEDD